jgi:undecaprenyl-diphosphatase
VSPVCKGELLSHNGEKPLWFNAQSPQHLAWRGLWNIAAPDGVGRPPTEANMARSLSQLLNLRSVINFARGEASVLAGIAVVTGLVLAFLSLADGVSEGDTEAFDTALLMLFRTPDPSHQLIGPLWLQEMMRDVTALGSFACLGLIVVGVAIYLVLAGLKQAALLMVVCVLSGTALSTVLKMGYDRPRPDLESFTHQFTSSFPSGHSMLSAVTYLSIGALLARLAPTMALKIYALSAAVFLTLLVGFSRLYLGVHFPSDILAGWCIGAAWALLWSVIAIWLQKRGQLEQPPAETLGDRPA